MFFNDRIDAGRKLAQALEKYKNDHVVVLALPRGGVPVAVEIARHLNAPLDLLLVRKIGLPMYPELAMGAIVDGSEAIVVRNEHVLRLADVPESSFENAQRREWEEIERRRRRYLGASPRQEVFGRIVIIVDDGIATGATMTAAIRALRQRKPSKIVVAVPVAPLEELAQLNQVADEIVCLYTPAFFEAIGAHYRDFRQLSDDDVVALIKSVPAMP
ncbi:phosphoribosyltransferase [Rhizobium mesosinicum]|uniref:Phosphoribosyltransferase n=1 Tax=Rhizobium mesosinicum TaxID=335017 RepID=A0ABS7GQT5_9HYPH|nr:phosphoribosyltransferase [Rhizobium mesosinicum]